MQFSSIQTRFDSLPRTCSRIILLLPLLAAVAIGVAVGQDLVLTPDTRLRKPPLVEVSGSDVTFTVTRFPKVVPGRSRNSASGYPRRAAVRRGHTLGPLYAVSIFQSGSANRVRKITSKKNVLTARNLPPGDYSANYTVSALEDGRKILFTTNTSPSASFTVSNPTQ